MNRYTLYCTEEQTKKAHALGAPLNLGYHNYDFENSIKIRNLCYAEIPTAEQMIGWLEDKGFRFDEDCGIMYCIMVHINNEYIDGAICTDSHKEATLAAIDAALEYLTNNDLIK